MKLYAVLGIEAFQKINDNCQKSLSSLSSSPDSIFHAGLQREQRKWR